MPPIKTARLLIREGEKQLAEAGMESSRLEAELLLSFSWRRERARLLAALEEVPPEETAAFYFRLLEKRASRYPLQYLLGRREFMSLDFEVIPGVLIPRGDTETLVQAVLERVDRRKKLVVADVGTGSGVVGLSLARYLPQSRVYVLDNSPRALHLARKNARRLQVEAQVVFCAGDFLEPLRGRKVDILASNPPYIPTSSLKKLPPEVCWEPPEALDGGEDGLFFYRRLAREGLSLLKPGGFMALEVDSCRAPAVLALFRQPGRTEIVKDLAGRDRVLLVKPDG